MQKFYRHLHRQKHIDLRYKHTHTHTNVHACTHTLFRKKCNTFKDKFIVLKIDATGSLSL